MAAQSRDEPEPYSFPAMMTQRHLLVAILHGRAVDGHFFAARLMNRPAALGAGRELVAQANIREGSAHHHFMIAATRAVGIEVLRLDAVRDQVFSSRAIGLDRAGWGDVIRRDAIAEHGQRTQSAQIRDGAWPNLHALEIWRILDVGGFVVPGVEIAFGNRQGAPVLVARENVGIFLGKHFAGHRAAHR